MNMPDDTVQSTTALSASTQVGAGEAPSTPPEDGAATIHKDIWTRSGSRYRIRAIVLLMVDVLLFAGVAGFAYWLRTGVRFAPAQDGYADDLRHTFGSVGIMVKGGVSLGSLLLEPINVQEVPMQIPILGLLMAALISVPILVSILYRFWSCLPFIAIVAFLAVMPWLAVTLLISCILASVRPFRTPFRFMSALFGLWPAAIYLVLAWLGTADAIAGRIDPIDRIKFVAPWVMAIVAATLVFATVLTVAKLVDYRPGAIAPTLALMLGLPVVLFELYVGRDELYYRLLENRSKAHFADADASAELSEAIERAWIGHPQGHRNWQAVRETVETRWLFGLTSDLASDQSALAEHQAELIEECDNFLRYFPTSPYAANALYLRARVLDMRVDVGEFRRKKWVRFYDAFPSSSSTTTWRRLAENYPETLVGRVALLRLAQVEAREGEVDRAVGRLVAMRNDLEGNRAGTQSGRNPDGALRTALTPQSPEFGLSVSEERLMLDVSQLHDLLSANRDPLYGDDPICGPRVAAPDNPLWFGLLDLDVRHDRYAANLHALRVQYPNCQLLDNLDLEIAKTTEPVEEKIALLEKCVTDHPDKDATPETLFRLTVAYRDVEHWEKVDETVSRLVNAHPDSIWTDLAVRSRLGLLRTRVSEGH